MNRSGTRSSRHTAERGQILVVFALSLMVLVSIVGLAVDAGGTFAQRRDQQTASDLAALAAANDYLINNNADMAIARAESVVADNGFLAGVNGTAVVVDIDTSNGVEVSVGVDALHGNTFLGAVGIAHWTVSTSGSALAGFPDTGEGAGPFIFSIGAFEDDGTPRYQTATNFGEGNGDIPNGPLDTAWTNYGTGNLNTTGVRAIIDGTTTITETLTYGEYIGQHNNGNHTALYGDVNTYLSGKEMPVAVVDGNGNFMGWAMFHVNSASGGSKKINGYFLSSFTSARLRVTSCAAGDCPRYLGSYVLKLSD
ncbi:MAG: pilus assembly protein TadG-related protein [Candidatus Limnocylindrales bacterium]